MYQRILVPLDGSERAEQALPIAARIAKTTKSTLVLLQVSHLGIEYGPYMMRSGLASDAITQAEQKKAHDYLTNLRHKALLQDIPVEIDAIPGLPVITILAYIQSHHIDLVVMCSHGYRGIKRWVLGSVASHICKQSSVPVLVTRDQSHMSKELQEGDFHVYTILVALDGSPLAEEILLPAAYLVSALSSPLQGRIHLIRLAQLPTFEEEMDAKFVGIDLDLRQEMVYDAGAYLQTVAEKLAREVAPLMDLHISWSVEECMDVADTLVSLAEHGSKIDPAQIYHILALATHGRHGVQRLLLGSIAERVIHTASLPLFVVRPAVK